jgi:hypothetical protein
VRESSPSTVSHAPNPGLIFLKDGNKPLQRNGRSYLLLAEEELIYCRFLFTIFFAIDACFRLKRKKISNWLADPSIQDGWSYFVRSLEYMEFVKTLGEQKEVSFFNYLWRIRASPLQHIR